MEHYKKRLIHQIQKPEQQEKTEKTTSETPNETPKISNNDDTTTPKEKEAVSKSESFGIKPEISCPPRVVDKKTEESETSSSGCPSTTSLDKKKEVIQKLARRKTVSRSHFRHDNIPVFKLGSSIHDLKKNIFMNTNTEKKPEKNIPKESLTADIIHAMDGNKSPLGRHHLPTIISSENLRKYTETSEKKISTHKEKPSDKTDKKLNEKSDKKREHHRREKNDKKYHCRTHSSEKKRSKSSIKSFKIRLEKSASQETASVEQIISEAPNKSDKDEESSFNQATEESHVLNNSSPSNEQQKTTDENDQQLLLYQHSIKVTDTTTCEKNKSENLVIANSFQDVASKNSKSRNSCSSKLKDQEHMKIFKTVNNNKVTDIINQKDIGISNTDTEMLQNNKNVIRNYSSSNIGKQNADTSQTPIINIQSYNENKRIDDANVIQIRIAPTSPLNEIKNTNPEIDDAYLESLLSLIKSTMQPTKLCIALLGILNFYYKDLSQRLETNISLHYKKKIRQTLDEILLYVEKQLFGIRDKPELKNYTKQIMESNLKENKDFVDVHLHVLDKKCDDRLWMEKFIQTLTQTKQYTKNNNEIKVNASNYLRNIPFQPEKTVINTTAPVLKGATIQNPTIMNDYYNVNASAKVLEKLQKYQLNITNTSLNNSAHNLNRTSTNEQSRSPENRTIPQNKPNQPFVVPDLLPNHVDNPPPLKEKRKYIKRRNSTQLSPESILLQNRLGYPEMMASNITPNLVYEASNQPRFNGNLPENMNLYNLAHPKKPPPEYPNYIKNFQETSLSRVKAIKPAHIVGNKISHILSQRNLNQQFGISTNPSSLGLGPPNLYANGTPNDKQVTSLNLIGQFQDPKLLKNNFPTIQNRLELGIPSAQNHIALYRNFPPELLKEAHNANIPNSANYDHWLHYKHLHHLNQYIESGKLTTNRTNRSPPTTRSYSFDAQMNMPNIPSLNKNVPSSGHTVSDRMNTSASKTAVNPIANTRSYAQNLPQSATNVDADHYNGMPIINRTHWNPSVAAEAAHFNQHISNDRNNDNSGLIPRHSSDPNLENGLTYGTQPVPRRRISLLSENRKGKAVNSSPRRQLNEPSSVNVASISAPFKSLRVQGISYNDFTERRIDKVRSNFQQSDTFSAFHNVGQNHIACGEPQDFSFGKNSHPSPQTNSISHNVVPEKQPDTTTKNSVRRNESTAFRVENLVSLHPTEPRNDLARQSPQNNTRPAVLPSFNFLEDIHSPPPSRKNDSPASQTTNFSEPPNSFRNEVAIATTIQTTTTNNDIRKENTKEIGTNTEVTETDNSNGKDVVVVKKVILQDNSMQITKEPVTRKAFKMEEQTDIVVVEKIKTDCYDMNDDKKSKFLLNNHFGGFDRVTNMVNILKSTHPEIYREVRRQTDLTTFGACAVEITEVITIDDDEETVTINVDSPETVTIEKITETSEEVPSKKQKLSEDTSSDSVIITAEKTTQLDASNSSKTELQCTTSNPNTSQTLDTQTEDNCRNISSLIETETEGRTQIVSRRTQIESRISGQIIEVESTDSEPTDADATDLSKHVSKTKFQLRPKDARTIEICYTTHGPISSPTIERQYSRSSVSTVSSNRLELHNSLSEYPTPPIDADIPVPGVEDISNEETQLTASASSDGVQTGCPSNGDLDWARSSLGTIVSRRRSSGPLDLSVEENLNSTSSFRSFASKDTELLKRQDLVTSPIHSDLTSVRSPIKYTLTKDWKSTFTEDQKKNFREFYKIRRHSVESRSSLSDTSSPVPLDDMATVTMGSSSFHIKKMFLEFIPKGKLYYKKETNTFVQCYVNGETRQLQIVNEPQLPQKWIFSSEADFHDAAHFSKEFEKVQKFVPKDFSQYYRFVTGYQIFHHKRPISFQTFLEMHNGDSMDTFFVKYLAHLQKFSLSGVSNPEDWKVT